MSEAFLVGRLAGARLHLAVRSLQAGLALLILRLEHQGLLVCLDRLVVLLCAVFVGEHDTGGLEC